MTEQAMMSDGTLWSLAAKQHDGSAFGVLFERHSSAVYAHCFRRTSSWSMAEDLTSIVFTEAWRKRKEVRLSGDSILPWLLAVANNATRNAERSIRRHRRLLSALPPPEPTPDIADDVAGRVDSEQAMREIRVALRALTASEREILELCDWAGLSYADAASALGIPLGTVRSRLARARQHLRDQVSVPGRPVEMTRNTPEDKS